MGNIDIAGFDGYGLLSLAAAAFLFLMWVQFAFWPDRYMRTYFDEPIETPTGRNQIRAMAGGTNLGLAAILVFGAFSPEHQAEAFVGVGLVGISIGLTRLAFSWRDRPHTWASRFDSISEPVGGFVLLFLGLRV